MLSTCLIFLDLSCNTVIQVMNVFVYMIHLDYVSKLFALSNLLRHKYVHYTQPRPPHLDVCSLQLLHPRHWFQSWISWHCWRPCCVFHRQQCIALYSAPCALPASQMAACHASQGADGNSLFHWLSSYKCHYFPPTSHFLYNQLKWRYQYSVSLWKGLNPRGGGTPKGQQAPTSVLFATVKYYGILQHFPNFSPLPCHLTEAIKITIHFGDRNRSSFGNPLMVFSLKICSCTCRSFF